MRFLVNTGSVGQPRDGDPRACYEEFDRGRGAITYRREEYPWSMCGRGWRIQASRRS